MLEVTKKRKKWLKISDLNFNFENIQNEIKIPVNRRNNTRVFYKYTLKQMEFSNRDHAREADSAHTLPLSTAMNLKN